jgi:hypothetical protein
MDSVLWLSMTWQSTKARDFLRDPRVLVHSVITSRDGTEGEFKVRGTARAEADLELRVRVGPFLLDQAAVPGQQGARRHDPVQPDVAGQQPTERHSYQSPHAQHP